MKLRYLQLVSFILTITLSAGCVDERNALDKIIDSGELRFATISSPISYFPVPGHDKGFEYELAKKFADHLGVNLKLIIAPNAQKIVSMTKFGKVDIGSAYFINGYTIDTLKFSPPYYEDIHQIVYRYGSRQLNGIDDIRPGDLNISMMTQYIEVMKDIKLQYPNFTWRGHKHKDVGTLIEQVGSGDIFATVASARLVKLYKYLYPNLRVAFDITQPQSQVWVYKDHNDNSLQDAISDFFSIIKNNGELDRLINHYFSHFEDFDFVEIRTYLERIDERLPKFEMFFKEAAKINDLDWMLLAAASYQESHWDPDARSPTGVRGLMMLTLDTAKQLGVKNRLDFKQSIKGGARYLRRVYERIPDRIQDPDRIWFTLAAYNIGLAHLEDARILTEKQGGDPDKWDDVKLRLPLLSKKEWYQQTRYGKARGEEPVIYVENIRRYFDLLRWIKYGNSTPVKKLKSKLLQALVIDTSVL